MHVLLANHERTLLLQPIRYLKIAQAN